MSALSTFNRRRAVALFAGFAANSVRKARAAQNKARAFQWRLEIGCPG
jgi:hypothetical protein